MNDVATFTQFCSPIPKTVALRMHVYAPTALIRKVCSVHCSFLNSSASQCTSRGPKGQQTFRGNASLVSSGSRNEPKTNPSEVDFQQTTRRCIPGQRALHIRSLITIYWDTFVLQERYLGFQIKSPVLSVLSKIRTCQKNLSKLLFKSVRQFSWVVTWSQMNTPEVTSEK